MRVFFFIALLTPLTLWAQFSFEPDSATRTRNIYLGTPDPDSIKFELRLWNTSTHFGIFTQLTLNQNDEWSYRTGIEKHNAEISYSETSKEVDINELWRKLDSLGIRVLENQNEASISVERDGKVYTLDEDQKDKMLGLHGSLIEIELFQGNNYRTYGYIDPVRLSSTLKKSKENWIADEHHAMAEIVKLIDTEFEMSKNFKRYFHEIRKKEDNKR